VSEQFAPVPYRALALAGSDPGSIALVVHLYAQGHTTRWGWLRFTVRELADRTTASKHRVEYLLGALVSEGLAEREIVSQGSRKDGTRFRLLNPCAGRDTGGDTGGDTGETRKPARAATPRAGAGHGPDTTADTTADTSTDLKEKYEVENNPPTPRGGELELSGGTAEPLLEAPDNSERLLARWNELATSIRRHYPANEDAIAHRATSEPARMLSARLNEHGVAPVEAVIGWYERAPDAEWFRQRVGLKALMRPQKFPEWLDKAEAWASREQQRPRPPPPREPEPPPLPPALPSDIPPPKRRRVIPA
jgi:hypothetical protein